MDQAPDQPLSPWREALHEQYYVDVDHMQEAYGQFKQAAADGRGLIEHGRLVTVVGAQGSGKTSLLNRCVAWSVGVLSTLGTRSVLVDLTRESVSHLAVTQRISVVAGSLLDAAETRLGLDTSRMDALRDRTPEGILRGLDVELRRRHTSSGDDVALIVLLPAYELEREMQHYARHVHPRIVFFAENSPYAPPPSARDWGRALPVAPIVLAVGALKESDGWLFAERRLRPHLSSPAVPRMGRTTLEQVLRSRPMQIKELQRLLFEIYEDAMSRPEPRSEIGYSDIAHFYARQLALGGGARQ